MLEVFTVGRALLSKIKLTLKWSHEEFKIFVQSPLIFRYVLLKVCNSFNVVVEGGGFQYFYKYSSFAAGLVDAQFLCCFRASCAHVLLTFGVRHFFCFFYFAYGVSESGQCSAH